MPAPQTSGPGGLPVERGHFLLESGLHSDSWLELDALFIDPAAVAAQVEALAELIAPHGVSAVCGPLLGGAFVAQAVATRLGLRFYVAEPGTPAPDGAALFRAVYRLPAGQARRAPGERFAVVDDVVSAGSSVRATVAELAGLGAEVAVIGALLRLGDRALEHFAGAGIPLVAPAARDFALWEPGRCPLCQAGTPVQRRQG